MAKQKPVANNNMMKQVQKMQEDMLAAQEALAAMEVEGSAGGGMVKAVVTGGGELRSVSISADVVDPDDIEMLEDLVVAAVSRGDARVAGAAVRADGRRHRRSGPQRVRPRLRPADSWRPSTKGRSSGSSTSWAGCPASAPSPRNGSRTTC